ncbi:hypothetical protein CsatB_003294 [Cannabis sativa]
MGGRTMHVDLQIITRIQTYSSPLSTQSSANNLNLFNPPVTVTVPAINGSGSSSSSASQSVFGPVPSQSEVQTAISLFQMSLNSFMRGVSSRGSNSKWLIEILDGPIPRILLSYGIRRLYEAFHLLQTDPFVKKLVVSLSSDKALWDAIMNNEVVRKFIEPLCLLAESERQNVTSEEEPNKAPITILKWIWDMIKAKAMEFIGQFLSLNEINDNPVEEKNNKEQLEDKVRSSLLLSILILLIVVVTRATN